MTSAIVGWCGPVLLPRRSCLPRPSLLAADSNRPEEEAAAAARESLKKAHGAGEAARIDRGVAQVARFWRPEDGDAAAFRAFVEAEFVPTGDPKDAVFGRLELALERIDGYFLSMSRDLRRGLDLDLGPLVPLDERLGSFEPAAHLSEDLFKSKLAFVALLNFPLTTLEERLAEGGGWSRRQWAEARLAQRFSTRIPAEVNAGLTQAYADAARYIADYNVYMHHVLTADGRRLFPPGLRLLSHWNLRDEIKARYADPEGLARQRLIAAVMDRIVRQEIPAVAVNNPLVDWTPETGAVALSAVTDTPAPPGARAEARPDREADERYRRWLGVFQAERATIPYYPDEPTLVDRRFNRGREIPVAQFTALLESVLTSPLSEKVGTTGGAALGSPAGAVRHLVRRLQAAGQARRGGAGRADPQALSDRRGLRGGHPAAAAGPGLRARPRAVRGRAHRGGAGPRIRSRDGRREARRPGAPAHARGPAGHGLQGLQHRRPRDGAQRGAGVLDDHHRPHPAPGRPQHRVHGGAGFRVPGPRPGAAGPGRARSRRPPPGRAGRVLGHPGDRGVALVDIAAWRWLEAHPEATPAQFRDAVVGIARDVWNRHFAPLFGAKDVTLLAIYSHMVDSGLYTPDYPLGHLIAFQVVQHFRTLKGPMGAEFERICQLGNLTPDAWMRQAVGAPVSSQPLLDAAATALEAMPPAMP
jgi:hypothetical protein